MPHGYLLLQQNIKERPYPQLREYLSSRRFPRFSLIVGVKRGGLLPAPAQM